MNLEFPWTWLRKPISKTLQTSLEAICKPPLIAVQPRVSDIGNSDLTLPHTHFYLLRQGDDVVSLLWSSLDENMKRKIAFDAMELSVSGLDGYAIEDHCSDLIDDHNDDFEQSCYSVLLSPCAITVVNETRLESTLENGDLSEINQDALDSIFLTLVIPPEMKSAHAVLSLQKEMTDFHEILIDRFLPLEINIATPQITLPK